MSNRKIGIIGYGIIGIEVESFISEDPSVQKSDFFYFDDLLYQKGVNNAFLFSDFDSNQFRDLEFYVCLGYSHPERKKEICKQLEKNSFSFPPLIHKTAYIQPTASIGSGVIVYPMCNVGFDVQISNGVLINMSTAIAHHTTVGRCTYISPGVTLSGNVQIGENCFFGAATAVSNGLKIGNNVKIGIGTAVTKDIDDDLSVIGNPFKIINSLNLK